MPTKAKPTAVHRPLLRDTWSLVWERKPLWVFGIFSAIIATGGVFETLGHNIRRITQGRDLLLDAMRGSFVGLDAFSQYVQLIVRTNPHEATTVVSVLAVLGLVIVLGAIVAQGGLIRALMAKKELRPEEVIHEGVWMFHRALVLAFLSKVVTVLLILLSTLPLVLFLSQATWSNALLFFFLFMAFIPAMGLVSAVSMLSLVDIAKQNSTVHDAVHNSFVLLKRAWLPVLELACTLFGLVLAGLIALTIILSIAAIPYTILMVLALLAGSPFLFSLFNIGGVIICMTLVLTYVGFTVTFQYAAWLKFYERAHNKKALVAKLERILG